MSDLIERMKSAAEEVAGWGAGNEAACIREGVAEIVRLRELLDRAAKSLEHNLYRQAEKLEWIAPAIRAALSTQPSEQGVGKS